jgi:hypothetical protein
LTEKDRILVRSGTGIAKPNVFGSVPTNATVFGRGVAVMLQAERLKRRHQFLDLRIHKNDSVSVSRGVRQANDDYGR